MFSRQKAQTDIKKSTQKLLDSKKDVATRLKHLKLILDTIDGNEAKAFFSTHYSHIYHSVYEGIIAAELALKQRGGILTPTLSMALSETYPFSIVHRAQREELESVLQLLEKILMLLPDLLHCRWQLHSMSRLMAKLIHPANSIRLRREAIRLFLMWYQCLGVASPPYVHSMFASLIPGLGNNYSWPANLDPSPTAGPAEITPVLPASPGERQPEDLTSFFMESLLDFMVSQSVKIHWNEGSGMWAKSIDFLYERFKELYLPKLFPDFSVKTDIYKPIIVLPEPRRSADMSTNAICNCQVVFVKWIANYAHSVYRPVDYSQQPLIWNANTQVHQGGDGKIQGTPPTSLSGDRDSIVSYSSNSYNDIDANLIAKDVILGSKANINFLHEIFRRALLMNFLHSTAIRRVICVYKDWIQINVPELPVFMLEPESEEPEHVPPLDPPKSRLRADSYYGAIGINANNNREEYLSHLRAGAQKVLRVFFCNSASVFLLFQIPKHDAAFAILEEQVDVCKRVLNIYRYAVMNTRMEPKTWEQLLVVMLHVTAKVLDQTQPHSGIKFPDTLGFKLASALFQTLIVSWVKASLNVLISVELWDQLKNVLSQLTFCDDLITEWAKTMETLTRVLSRHVYNLDLANLPLDRLTEQKAKKRRAGQPTSGVFNKDNFKSVSECNEAQPFQRMRHGSSSASSDRKSLIFSPHTLHLHKKLGYKRSLSEGNITLAIQRESYQLRIDRPEPQISIESSKPEETPEKYLALGRRRSRSMTSLRKMPLGWANHMGMGTQLGEWVEISSSTGSLNNSTIHNIDGDTNSIASEAYDGGKIEVRGVIAGGQVKGWLPSVAAILWRRMLGILGDVNEFQNPKTHAHFFQVLSDIWGTLFKIRLNQGVSLDNTSSPKPPELVPPLTLIAPWCLKSLDLPSEFYKGKIIATSLLAKITLANQDIPFQQDYLCKFYASIHKIIISNQLELINEIVKVFGLNFVHTMLPGFSSLFLDLVQASHSVLTSEDLKKAPRMEAATLLASILTVAESCRDLPILKPNSPQFQPLPSHQTADICLTCLIKFSKIEQTSHARAICIQALTIFLAKDLMELRHGLSQVYSSIQPEQKNRINTIVAILLACVKVANRSVALVASDLLLYLAEFTPELSKFPKLCSQIILGLKSSIQFTLPLKNSSWSSGKPIEMEKRLLISLMLTLGEWTMKLPLDLLLNTSGPDKLSLISSVFEALIMATKGYQSPSENNLNNRSSLEEFDPSIPFDDLQNIESLRSMGKESPFSNQSDSTNQGTIVQDMENVKLAARTLILHLLTQVGHFPMTNTAARCGSIISENDDIPGALSELDELSSYVFSLPNLQMFALGNHTLLSIVELPADSNEGISSEFQSVSSHVRIIMRDLSGKASWDAVNLLSSPKLNINEELGEPTYNPLYPNADDFYPSAITGSFIPQMGTRLTLRRRPTGMLPMIENSADDLDNLDDLLHYVGHTSPECMLRVGEPLTASWAPPPSLTQEIEDDVVASVVNQRNTELEYLLKFDHDPTMRPTGILSTVAESLTEEDIESEGNLSSLAGASSTKSVYSPSNFLFSRRIFSQLGFNGWDNRSTVDLINKDDRLLRELKHLDSQKCREAHKIAVIYVGHGQEDKQSILFNTGGSEAYEDFVSGLGWEVELECHTGFMGGLHRNKSSGETAPYYATSFTEVIFHVATRMPSSTEECLLQKTRHLGNDEVHIVWSEHSRDYRRDIIPTEFCDVLIVIYPLKFGLFRIQISRKPEVPYFGPLFNEVVVEKDVLSSLIRATAINASRARRASLPFYQHHFEERAKSLATIIQNHKVRTTFENFSSNVFCPMSSPLSFHSGTANRASGTSFSSRVSAQGTTTSGSSVASQLQLASALLDSSISPSSFSGSRRATTGPATGFHDIPLNLGGKSESSSVPQSPLPPIPPKRLSIKLGSGLKPKLQTPPASPATGRPPPPYKN